MTLKNSLTLTSWPFYFVKTLMTLMNNLTSLTRSVSGHDLLMAVFSFFTVAFGGAFFGFLHGIFCSAITRLTPSKHEKN